jgi:hypothetical protein
MARVAAHQISFDSPATVAELIEALQDLRAQVGNDALVRMTGFIEFHQHGPRIKSVSAEKPKS